MAAIQGTSQQPSLLVVARVPAKIGTQPSKLPIPCIPKPSSLYLFRILVVYRRKHTPFTPLFFSRWLVLDPAARWRTWIQCRLHPHE